MKGIFELEEAKEPEGNNILIVDSLNLAFRYKHAGRTDFAHDYYQTVKSLAKSYDAAHVIIACDWGKSSYRKKMYPEYKADREVKIANQTEEEKQAFLQFFEDFEKTIEYLTDKFTVLKYKGVEADDIAAYLTHHALKNYSDDIWLVSSDKDWDLLLKDNVHRFSYVTRKEYKLDNWSERHEYPHEIALDIMALVGGKDNVTGIAGVGVKRAHLILDSYGSAVDIYANLPLPGKAKYIQNTNDFGENILRNLQLIDMVSFCIEAIGLDNVKDIDKNVQNLR